MVRLPSAQLPAEIASSTAFYTVSACRDLLFHVQEHQFTLLQISSFLQQNQLEFIGCELSGPLAQNYQTRFPDDKTLTDLASWNLFETENPTTFAGMYQF